MDADIDADAEYEAVIEVKTLSLVVQETHVDTDGDALILMDPLAHADMELGIVALADAAISVGNDEAVGIKIRVGVSDGDCVGESEGVLDGVCDCVGDEVLDGVKVPVAVLVAERVNAPKVGEGELDADGLALNQMGQASHLI